MYSVDETHVFCTHCFQFIFVLQMLSLFTFIKPLRILAGKLHSLSLDGRLFAPLSEFDLIFTFGNSIDADKQVLNPKLLKLLHLNSFRHLTDAVVLEIFNVQTSTLQLNFENWRSIEFAHSRLGSIGLSVLTESLGRQLQHLNLRSCRRITDIGIETIGKFCPELIELNLGCTSSVNDRSFRPIAQNCTQLKKLVINKTGIKSLSFFSEGSFPELREFAVECCDINDQDLEHLHKGCPRLTRLSLSGCDVSAEGIADHVVRRLSKLQLLRLNRTHVDNKCVELIPDHLGLLRSLHVKNCVCVTPECISAFAGQKLPLFRCFDISDMHVRHEIYQGFRREFGRKTVLVTQNGSQ